MSVNLALLDRPVVNDGKNSNRTSGKFEAVDWYLDKQLTNLTCNAKPLNILPTKNTVNFVW